MQILIELGAYHREIGREATAPAPTPDLELIAYHREIGREATASGAGMPELMLAYHREIGREATAKKDISVQLIVSLPQGNR